MSHYVKWLHVSFVLSIKLNVMRLKLLRRFAGLTLFLLHNWSWTSSTQSWARREFAMTSTSPEVIAGRKRSAIIICVTISHGSLSGGEAKAMFYQVVNIKHIIKTYKRHPCHSCSRNLTKKSKVSESTAQFTFIHSQ